jgi:hypothetical protein
MENPSSFSWMITIPFFEADWRSRSLSRALGSKFNRTIQRGACLGHIYAIEERYLWQLDEETDVWGLPSSLWGDQIGSIFYESPMRCLMLSDFLEYLTP